MKNSNKPEKLQNALKELNEIEIIDKSLRESKNECLRDFIGEFEMVGRLKDTDHPRESHIRFKNIDDHESYINAIDQDYDSEDAMFNGYIYKLNTPQFNSVNRSKFGNGFNFKQQFIEYHGKNCFIPSKGYCCVKCISFLTGKDYIQQHLDFITNEKRRSKILTMARIQPFCRSNIVKLGYFDVFPRSVKDGNFALFSDSKSFLFNIEVRRC